MEMAPPGGDPPAQKRDSDWGRRQNRGKIHGSAPGGVHVKMNSPNAGLATVQKARLIAISAHAAVHDLQVIHDHQITRCPDVFEDAQLLLG